MSARPDLSLPDDIQLSAVGALLTTSDGRYLIQLRDDRNGVRMRGHWGVFGGEIESGEEPEEALLREMREELDFTPSNFSWFTEITYCLHQVGRRYHRKHFYEVLIAPEEIERMELREGAAMELLTVEALLAQPKIVPWDVYAVLLHSRRATTFALYHG